MSPWCNPLYWLGGWSNVGSSKTLINTVYHTMEFILQIYNSKSKHSKEAVCQISNKSGVGFINLSFKIDWCHEKANWTTHCETNLRYLVYSKYRSIQNKTASQPASQPVTDRQTKKDG